MANCQCLLYICEFSEQLLESPSTDKIGKSRFSESAIVVFAYYLKTKDTSHRACVGSIHVYNQHVHCTYAGSRALFKYFLLNFVQNSYRNTYFSRKWWQQEIKIKQSCKEFFVLPYYLYWFLPPFPIAW